MLCDVCFQFLFDTASPETTADRIGECAAELADRARGYHYGGYGYGIETYAVLKAAHNVIAVPHDSNAVKRLKREARAVQTFHDCPPPRGESPPEAIKYYNNLWDAVIAAAKDILGSDFEATERAALKKQKYWAHVRR
jgi:hypothetical protein